MSSHAKATLIVGVHKVFDAQREWAYHDLSERGLLRAAIRDAISQSGYAMNVLSGKKVLIKPNWVLHINQAPHDVDCLYTQPEFVLAAIEEVLIQRPSQIVVGDAPIQSCGIDQIVTQKFREQVATLSRNYCIPVAIKDFRKTIVKKGGLGEGVDLDASTDSDHVLFDLGSDSLLEPITTMEHKFRVTNYDPRRLAETHNLGRHQYLIARDVLESEVVLSLPKLKTHKKAGITAALKNLVGTNGNKDFLPHHRIGSPKNGGDCYSRPSIRNRLFEVFLDLANQNIGKPAYKRWMRFATWFSSGQGKLDEGGVEGGWHGNDTVWRMTLDLNRILYYGTIQGDMRDDQQRRVLSLTDAIVCGEGEGPLSPSPRSLGMVTFSESTAAADFVHALLMGFDPGKISLVTRAFDDFRWRLVDPDAKVEVISGGVAMSPEEFADSFGIEFVPPAGWRGFIERTAID